MIKLMYICIAVTIIAGGLGLWLIPREKAPVAVLPTPEVPSSLCTMDAMRCADGSYVGRTGKNCEFVCPATPTSTTSLATSTATTTSDLIVVITPTKNSLIATSTLIIGRARGSWFFEGSFPVQLIDAKGNVLVQTVATATGDWMTADFVPFTSTLTFTNPQHLTAGIVRFKNDNPSGLPQNDKKFDVPVRFTP